MADAPPITPECPRCGYDLAGTPRAHDSGTCPECGLAFAWADILNPDLQRVRGFIEHAPLRHQWPWWSWRTFFSSFHAARFWRKVRLESPIKPWRWVVYVVCTVGVPWVLLRVYAMFILIRDGIFTTVRPANVGEFIGQYILGGVIGRDWNSFSRPGKLPPFVIHPWEIMRPGVFAAAAICTMMPLMLLVLPYTRARLRIRWRHVARAAVFGALPVWIGLFLSTVRTLQTLIEHYGFFKLPAFGRQLALGNGRTGWSFNITITWPIVRFMHDYQLTLAFAAFAWVLWWWAMALKRGFRADQWKQILVAQSVAALLAAAVVALLHPGGQWLLYRVLA